MILSNVFILSRFAVFLIVGSSAERLPAKQAALQEKQRTPVSEVGGKKKGGSSTQSYHDPYYAPSYPHQDSKQDSYERSNPEPTHATYDPYRHFSSGTYSYEPAQSCGGHGEECCEHFKCKHPGLGCLAFSPEGVPQVPATCGVCGGEDQPCCVDACKKKNSTESDTCSLQCNGGFQCSAQGICKKCGSHGNPCCKLESNGSGTTNGPFFLSIPTTCTGDDCDIDTFEGDDNIINIGNNGNPGSLTMMSIDNGQCELGARCNNGQCEACGVVGQRCCGNKECELGARCNNGQCEACGVVGQRCCGDNECELGGQCESDKCVACGLAGTICCRDSARPSCVLPGVTCEEDLCGPCGDVGEACCLGLCAEEFICEGNTCVSS